jgi:hypothetical protein
MNPKELFVQAYRILRSGSINILMQQLRAVILIFTEYWKKASVMYRILAKKFCIEKLSEKESATKLIFDTHQLNLYVH